MSIYAGQQFRETATGFVAGCDRTYNIRLYPNLSYNVIGDAPLFSLMKHEVVTLVYYAMSTVGQNTLLLDESGLDNHAIANSININNPVF